MGTALQSPAAPRASSYYKTILGIVSAYLLRTNSHHFWLNMVIPANTEWAAPLKDSPPEERVAFANDL